MLIKFSQALISTVIKLKFHNSIKSNFNSTASVLCTTLYPKNKNSDEGTLPKNSQVFLMSKNKLIPDGCLEKKIIQFFESMLNTSLCQFRKCKLSVTAKISTKNSTSVKG